MFPKSLEDIKTKYLKDECIRIEKKIEELRKISQQEPNIAKIAEEEISDLERQKNSLIEQAESLLQSKNQEEESKSIIFEIRAGTGGEEASLFAFDLAKMYEKYSAKKNWKFQKLNESKTELNGYKEAVFEISGPEVYKKLKNESGVHRIQRIPSTEKSGRIHTSTASIVVLPEKKYEDIEIKPEDLEIGFTRAGGPGGQNVNKVETAVRILHKPSQIVVVSQNERSQQRNKEKALDILKAKISDLKKQKDEKKLSKERKQQIGTQDRSEKIRTYNILQDRVTDHRLKKSWHNIENIFEGNIDSIIESFE
ncbi:MAG: PCRF domain-containing protein [Patescibacteria group bacterium]